MPEIEYLPRITRRTKEILAVCQVIETELDHYPVEPAILPDVEREITIVRAAIRDLLALTTADRTAVKVSRITQPGWDFMPWFREKTTRMEKSCGKLVALLTDDPDAMKMHPAAPMTRRQWFRDGIALELGEIQHCAKALDFLTSSRELRVTNVGATG